MRVLALALAGLLLTAAMAQSAESVSADIDLTAFANGALIEHASSIYGSGWEPIGLLDEEPATGWTNADGDKAPFDIVIALPEQSEIHTLEFDTAQVEKPERAAKDVDVMISDEGPTSGFTLLQSVQLDASDNQLFPLTTPGKGRWLKLVIKSNGGDSDYSEIMDFKALGIQLTNSPLPNVAGTYASDSEGTFHLSQDGAQLTGCYEHNSGLFQGGLESHLMRLTWSEDGGGHGPALMILRPDGKSFLGMWQYEGDSTWNADWDLHKISDKVGSCPNWNPKDTSGNLVTKALTDDGRVRLYGINFDSDKDVLRADAKPTLEQVKQALAANPGWHVTIEGYTDSTSTPEHNVDLSQRRADAVVAYLAAGGIPAGDMTAHGLGDADPVATNDTAMGRAQNRRVEIARQ